MIKRKCGCVCVPSVDLDYVIVFQACEQHGGGNHDYRANYVKIGKCLGEYEILTNKEEEFFMSGYRSNLQHLENQSSRFETIRQALSQCASFAGSQCLAGWKLVGHFGVDAGLVWIGDPCYVLHKEASKPDTIGKNWGEFCDIIGNKDITVFGFTNRSKEGLGICLATGWGDGDYPVYARIEDGRVMQIYIDFDEA
jgi:hypothetical protein